ncbi:hypothetical protein IK110_01900 [Candidatus Saccharibacteria bacterium]|nr:hypothetical protein [Candidatus Saccharibacteria bacterium]
MGLENKRIGEKPETPETSEQLPQPVYYIESPNDDTVLVGIDVKVCGHHDGEKNVVWYDTTRERRMKAIETQMKDDFFAFRRDESEGGGEYFFTPMNLNIYNDKVKQKLIDGNDYTDEKDLTEAFLKTKENEL